MKKIIFLTIALGFISVGTFAQASITMGGGQPAANVQAEAKQATDKLSNLVNLTQDQYNQVMQVNKNFFSQRSAAGNGRPAARLSAERDQQLKGILTADQWQTYQNSRNNNGN